MAAAGFLDTWWGYVLAIFLIGPRQHALSLLSHDAVHGHVVKRKSLNDLATNIVFNWPFMLNLETYRDFHFRHHRFLATAPDPELAVKAWSAPAWDLPLSRARLAALVLIDLLGMGVIYHKQKTFFHWLRNRNEREARAFIPEQFSAGNRINYAYLAQVLSFWTLLIVVLAATQTLWVLWLWFAALLTSFLASFHLRTWMEHVGATDTHRLQATWWQKALFLPHNCWYHHEHHAYPAVPLWNLPRLRELAGTNPPVITVAQAFSSLAKTPPS